LESLSEEKGREGNYRRKKNNMKDDGPAGRTRIEELQDDEVASNLSIGLGSPMPVKAPLPLPPSALIPNSEIKKRTGGGVSREVLQACVKIFGVHTEPNYSMPWQMKRQKKSTSSGFVISGRRILTNAHSIVYQTSVHVRKHGSAKKYIATVLAEGHESDLAMLTVEDDSFWEGITPLEFGEVPHLQDSVTVIGYPTGGDNISITQGIVSRVDYVHYTHGCSKLLAIQIDAAINSGNSGGPALGGKGNKVVGISFETLVNAENIGYIIPSLVIEHFLEDIERHNKYTGFCEIGIVCQSMENPQLKKFLKMEDSMTGLIINRVDPLGGGHGVIEKDDVLLEIDGVPIADDCTVKFRDDERISFKHLLLNKFVGDETTLSLLRSGSVIQRSVEMKKTKLLVPLDFEKPPSYFIYAGLVFVPLTQLYLRHQWGKQWDRKAPVRLCDLAINSDLKHPDQQIVLLSQVLVHDVNTGYQHTTNIQVHKFNGVEIQNLQHLVSLVEDCRDSYVRFDLEFQRVVILDHQLAQQATAEILTQHAIANNKSKDLKTTPSPLHFPVLSIPGSSADGAAPSPIATRV